MHNNYNDVRCMTHASLHFVIQVIRQLDNYFLSSSISVRSQLKRSNSKMPNPIRSAFIYLMQLAWKSRLQIPFLLTVCFLVFDIRLQLEVNINMTRRRAPRLIARDNDNNDNYAADNVDFNIDDDVNENDDDDDDEDDDEEDDDDLNNHHASGIVNEKCQRIFQHDIQKFTNVINILPSFSVPVLKLRDSSEILIITPCVFRQLSDALEKHYKKRKMMAPSAMFKSSNSPTRCIS